MLVIQNGVSIYAHLTVSPNPAGAGFHNVQIRWENRLYTSYTVLLERFRRDAPPSQGGQPDNIDEAILPAANPGVIFDSYGSVTQTHCVDTNRYRYVSSLHFLPPFRYCGKLTFR